MRPSFLQVLVLGGLLVLSACTSQKRHSAPVSVSFQPTELKALTIQEKITRADEVMLAYSLSVLDENNQLTSTQNGIWGVQRVQKDDQFTNFQGLSLSVPPKSKVVATVVLMEIDDYSRAQKFVGEIRKYTGVAGAVAGFFQVTELTNPVGYFLLSLQAAGLVLNQSRWIDPDDLLGADTKTYTYDELQKGLPVTITPLKFSNHSRLDRYEYRLQTRWSIQKTR
ncbi:hypothetical protein BWI97_16060 [Siphonobacter sp. BAB-5405]|uniref:hypothetical protein n=1 Tax=Siphonobacter sp. BAB-5405 TaxID=1864825 RepID=UPI000C7F90F8|nr:hypothetical protein [Siphonobacter sp. BAB-5405]PMD94680.1 hypothetical protein BWI97_16060 [Siphonobacter sp. BAB-5405]